MNPFGSAFTDLTGIAGTSRNARHSMLQAHAQNQLHGQRSYEGALAQLQNAYPQLRATPEAPKERTPEEVREQLEARYAEMEAEAERKAKAALTACSLCRWSDGAWCRNPLVIGIDAKPTLNVDRTKYDASLCGPEKALWELPEPKRTIWQRFIDWFLDPWADELATSRTKR